MTPVERFWILVDRRGPEECWPYIGRRTALGYGRFKTDERDWYANRYAYILEHGAIPKGAVICHKCDWPPCVNPAHLVAAPNGENIKDAARKGRMLHVLTLGQVEDIVRARAGGESIVSLTLRYGVSRGCIRGHVRGLRSPGDARASAMREARRAETRPEQTQIVFLAKASGA